MKTPKKAASDTIIRIEAGRLADAAPALGRKGKPGGAAGIWVLSGGASLPCFNARHGQERLSNENHRTAIEPTNNRDRSTFLRLHVAPVAYPLQVVVRLSLSRTMAIRTEPKRAKSAKKANKTRVF